MKQLSLFDVDVDGLTFSTREEAEVYTSAYNAAWGTINENDRVDVWDRLGTVSHVELGHGICRDIYWVVFDGDSTGAYPFDRNALEVPTRA